ARRARARGPPRAPRARSSPRGPLLLAGLPRRPRRARRGRPRAYRVPRAGDAPPTVGDRASPRHGYRGNHPRLPVRLAHDPLARLPLPARRRRPLGRIHRDGSAPGVARPAPQPHRARRVERRGRTWLASLARPRPRRPRPHRSPAADRAVRSGGPGRGGARLALREPRPADRVAARGTERVANLRAAPVAPALLDQRGESRPGGERPRRVRPGRDASAAVAPPRAPGARAPPDRGGAHGDGDAAPRAVRVRLPEPGRRPRRGSGPRPAGRAHRDRARVAAALRGLLRVFRPPE